MCLDTMTQRGSLSLSNEGQYLLISKRSVAKLCQYIQEEMNTEAEG